MSWVFIFDIKEHIMLYLYLLERHEEPREYDITLGFVIAATDESHARQLAYDTDTDKSLYTYFSEVWIDESVTRCTRIGMADTKESGVILHSIKAG